MFERRTCRGSAWLRLSLQIIRCVIDTSPHLARTINWLFREDETIEQQIGFSIISSEVKPGFGRHTMREGVLLTYYVSLSQSQVQKVHSPNLPKKKCICEVVRIGSIIIFQLSKLWKFSIVWRNISDEAVRRNFKLITLGSETVQRDYMINYDTLFKNICVHYKGTLFFANPTS